MNKLQAKAKMTLVETFELAEKCRINVGREIEYIDHLTGQVLTGRIKSVWIDKRVPLALYYIDQDGIRRNKVVTSNELNIIVKDDEVKN